MDRRLNLPVFGTAPGEYDRSYLDDISRKLNILISALRNPGVGRQSTLVLTNLPTSDYGLEAGSLYSVNNGALRISMLNAPYLVGISASSSIGSVTVTT